MTDRLTEIRERLSAATPGPWSIGDSSCEFADDDADKKRCLTGHGWEHHPCYDINPGVVSSWGHDADGVMMDWPDADLIAHAPDDLAHLLAIVERVRKVQIEMAQSVTWASGDKGFYAGRISAILNGDTP